MGHGLNARTKEYLQIDEFPDADRATVFADFRPKKLGRHKKGPRKTMGGTFLFHLSCEHREQGAPVRAPKVNRCRSPVCEGFTTTTGCRATTPTLYLCRKAVDVVHIDHQHLDAPLFQQFH